MDAVHKISLAHSTYGEEITCNVLVITAFLVKRHAEEQSKVMLKPASMAQQKDTRVQGDPPGAWAAIFACDASEEYGNSECIDKLKAQPQTPGNAPVSRRRA